MKTAKRERAEFNPQISITDMMIGKNGTGKQKPHHIAYNFELTL